ncbi:hypothetical protein VPHD85_0006 [Vibrio phage D85]|nr:hypothetical protein PODOV033v1_p0066 [Vibrio phage 252E42.2]
MATKINRGVMYSGTHGNDATAVGIHAGGCASGDIIEFGKLPPGVGIKRVVVGTDRANASAAAEVAIIKDDGSKVVLLTGADINNKMTSADLMLNDVGFDQPLLQVTVSGGAVSASSKLAVYVEYVTLGTK